MKWVCDLFTERNNQTFDLKRVLWASSVVWFMVTDSLAVVIKGQSFDAIAVSTGLAGLIAAGGAALAMNRGTENGGGQ